MEEHKCPLPELGTGMITAYRHDWECGMCGRLWRVVSISGYGHWQEVRGPKGYNIGTVEWKNNFSALLDSIPNNTEYICGQCGESLNDPNIDHSPWMCETRKQEV